MADQEWVPVKWRCGTGDPHDPRAVYVEARNQRDGTDLYAVTCLGDVLNRDGDFEHEPIPSSRTDQFIERTRFKTFLEAAKAYAKYARLAVPAPQDETTP